MKNWSLPAALLLCASSAAAQVRVGCTPVAAEAISEKDLAGARESLPPGEAAEVPALGRAPGVEWDLGEERTARLSVYLTRTCALGLQVSAATGGETSSPDPNSAVAALERMLRVDAPDWSFSVEAPNTIRLSKGATTYETDLRKLLQLRLDAATSVELNGAPARVLYDGFLLFIVPENAEKSVNLSIRSTVYPWAYYDLTPYGLPRLLVRFEDGKAFLRPLP